MVPCVLKSTAIGTLWLGALLIGCGVAGPEPLAGDPQQDSTEEGGAGGASGGSGGANASSSSSSSSTSSTSSSSSSGGGGPPEPETCQIMSSNVLCASYLEDKCCDPFHACLDEDLFGCMACLDCFLEGNGPECCDQDVGLNKWLVECVAYNCEDEC